MSAWTEDDYAERGYRSVKLRVRELERDRLDDLAEALGEPRNVIVGRLIDEEFCKVFKR